MLHRDYILRIVEQFARSLASVIRLRTTGDPQAAQVELAQLTQGFLGIDDKLLFSLSDAQLISLFTVADKLDSGRALVAQGVLAEAASIQDALDAPEQGETYRLRALSLLLEILSRDPLFRTPEYKADLSSLLEAVGDDPPVSLRLKLFRTFAVLGEFGKAEDHLFELVESGVDEVVPEGLAFYERLLALEDAELVRGGLPRAEIEEAVAQLRRLGF